jgi:nitroreductase
MAALDNRKAPLRNQRELDDYQPPNPARMAKILLSRRSIRSYLDKPVSAGQLRAILEVARCAPTAKNSQGLSFRLITERATLSAITPAVISWLEAAAAADAPGAASFQGTALTWRKTGRDVILRNAPSLIVAYADKSHSQPQNNCAFVWAYAELFAPALGLGTCIAGYVAACAQALWPPLLELLAPPRDTLVAGALLAGYPRYSYKRLPERRPLRIYQ